MRRRRGGPDGPRRASAAGVPRTQPIGECPVAHRVMLLTHEGRRRKMEGGDYGRREKRSFGHMNCALFEILGISELKNGEDGESENSLTPFFFFFFSYFSIVIKNNKNLIFILFFQ